MNIYRKFFRLEEKNGAVYSYHSIQLPLKSCGPVDYFYQLQKDISDGDLYHENSVRPDGTSYIKYGREDDPHVTLCYGLKNFEDYEKIKQHLATIPKFSINLGSAGFFRDEAQPYCVRVIFIDDPTGMLRELNNYIRKNFDVFVSYPDYNPHMTIAYCKKGFGIRDGGRHQFQGQEIKIQEFEWCHKDDENRYLLPLK